MMEVEIYAPAPSHTPHNVNRQVTYMHCGIYLFGYMLSLPFVFVRDFPGNVFMKAWYITPDMAPSACVSHRPEIRACEIGRVSM